MECLQREAYIRTLLQGAPAPPPYLLLVKEACPPLQPLPTRMRAGRGRGGSRGGGRPMLGCLHSLFWKGLCVSREEEEAGTGDWGRSAYLLGTR